MPTGSEFGGGAKRKKRSTVKKTTTRKTTTKKRSSTKRKTSHTAGFRAPQTHALRDLSIKLGQVARSAEGLKKALRH